MAMGRHRGRRNKAHDGAAEGAAASPPSEPARVKHDNAGTSSGKPPEDRGPGPAIPWRNVALVMVGVAAVVVALISSVRMRTPATRLRCIPTNCELRGPWDRLPKPNGPPEFPQKVYFNWSSL